jgi:nitrogenase molybdenum-cofactor synthesis protein NifE
MSGGLQGASERWGVPVVPVDCAGFYGTKNLGNRIAGEAMFKHVIGTREPTRCRPKRSVPGITVHDVNLIGEYNIAGEFWHVLPLFDELGLRILVHAVGRCPLSTKCRPCTAPKSAWWSAPRPAECGAQAETQLGVPFFEGSFYGVTDTSQACATSPASSATPT